MTTAYYSQATHGPFEIYEIGDFVLESGAKIRNLSLAYATFGELAADKSNAVLFPTWYSGTSKILEQAYVGPGRALDPAKYFIILVNQIGNGLSSSPSNTPAPFGAARFPQPSIGDDVKAQHRLITEKFGVDRLALVLGGSMGAQQSWEWAARFPDSVARIAPIAGTAQATPHNRLLVETFIEAIVSDPAFAEGWFAEDFVTGFVENHFLPQDPNNLLTLLRKWRDGDVARLANGDLPAALGRIKALTQVIAIEEDAFFPLKDLAAEQALVPGASLRRVSSPWGHLALFGVDASFNAKIDGFLNELLATPA